MISYEFVKLDGIALHKVGNKTNNDALRISKVLVNPEEEISELLQFYFLSQFKQSEFFNLYHESDIEQNTVYASVTSLFENKEKLYEESVNIAKHLYEQSIHPNVKPGELFVVYMNDCMYNGEPVDAVGIFKSESRETYLKVYPTGENFDSSTNVCTILPTCPTGETWKSGYGLCIADPTCPTNMTFDSTLKECTGGSVSLNLSQINLASISNSIAEILREIRNLIGH